MYEQFKIDIKLNGCGATYKADTVNLHIWGYVYKIFQYDNESIIIKVFDKNDVFIKSVEVVATDYDKILDKLFSNVK